MSLLEQFASTGAGTNWILECPPPKGEHWLLCTPIIGDFKFKVELMQFVLVRAAAGVTTYLFAFRSPAGSTYVGGKRIYHSPRTIVFSVDYPGIERQEKVWTGQKLLTGVEVLNYSNERKKCPKR